MTDYIWPSSLVPSSSEWRLVANTVAFTSPLSGTTRTLARGGDRWVCTLTFNNLRDSQRAILQAFLAQLRGQANRVYIRDHAYRRRGTFPTVEHLPDFSSATPWTTGFSTLAVADGVGRITATSHTGSEYPQINVSLSGLTSGANYAFRVFYTRTSTGTASVGPAMNLGSFSSSYATTIGLRSLAAAASSTTGTAIIALDGTGSSTATGDFCDVPYASLARCMTVSGGSQTGSVLTVDNTGGFTLLAGDRIEVNGEFHIIADTMIPAGSGIGKVYLAKPLRTSPANGAPVIVHDPLCRMMLNDNTIGWSNAPGRFSSFTVEFMEDLL